MSLLRSLVFADSRRLQRFRPYGALKIPSEFFIFILGVFASERLRRDVAAEVCAVEMNLFHRRIGRRLRRA